MDPIIRDGSILAIDPDDKKMVRRGIYAIVPPEGGWTIKLAKQSGHLLLLQAANLWTEDNFPPLHRPEADPRPHSQPRRLGLAEPGVDALVIGRAAEAELFVPLAFQAASFHEAT